MNNKENFLKGIQEKLLVIVTFNSDKKGTITRRCVPFDFGPSGKNDAIDMSDKYQLWDLESPDVPPHHNLSLKPEKVINIQLTDDGFNPGDYVTWQPPYKWHIARDWGQYS